MVIPQNGCLHLPPRSSTANEATRWQEVNTSRERHLWSTYLTPPTLPLPGNFPAGQLQDILPGPILPHPRSASPAPELLSVIKKLHETSASPTSRFGFYVTTIFGPPPTDNTWTDSWGGGDFTREFRSSVAYAHLPLRNNAEFAELADEFITTVIPPLLRHLKTGGRSIKPTLCFGDLWDANVRADALANRPFLYDPCCFYGHNESWIPKTPTKKSKHLLTRIRSGLTEYESP